MSGTGILRDDHRQKAYAIVIFFQPLDTSFLRGPGDIRLTLTLLEVGVPSGHDQLTIAHRFHH